MCLSSSGQSCRWLRTAGCSLLATLLQVVHHPCVLAVHAEGPGWVLEGDADMRNSFRGTYIEVAPTGLLRVTFSDGEAYEWNKVRC